MHEEGEQGVEVGGWGRLGLVGGRLLILGSWVLCTSLLIVSESIEQRILYTICGSQFGQSEEPEIGCV